MQEKLLKLLTRIPNGKVATYGAIGKILNINPRYVGRLLHSNPAPGRYPCHRVIKSDGSIASGYAFGGREMQIAKLQGEGIEIVDGKVVDLQRHLFEWPGK